MKKRSRRTNSTCPVTFALDILGDKWSLLILRDMFFKGKSYYSEFLTSPEQISTNILADRLNRLELEGIISKTPDPQNSVKYIYRPGEKGKDLLPLMLEMVVWSAKYDPQPEVGDHIIDGAPANLVHRFQQDRAALLTEILSALE